MITYLKGDATRIPSSADEKYLVHVSNNQGGWGAGFVKAISKRWAAPERSYRAWYKVQDNPIWGRFELGNRQIIRVEPGLSVVNMIAQSGYGTGNTNQHQTSEPNTRPPIRYDALEKCLEKVATAAKASGASVHGPRFGSGLSGGSWDVIEPIIERTLVDLSVTIYNL
jgi:O-acetyl-ADP-ribose deacetylase (regulator of RNase III)